MTLKTSLLVLLSAATACTDAEPAATTQVTQDVVQHHIEALLANDMDGLLSDYDESSRVFMGDKTFSGLEEIKGLATSFFQVMPPGQTTMIVDALTADEELLYMTYHGDSPFITVPYGSDTMVVEGGKIVRQTVAIIIQPKS
jgi:hypothetical protein